VRFLPPLLGREERADDEFLHWEFPSYGGQQALRLGSWEALREDSFEANMAIRWYDLEKDIQESRDVADQHPDVVKQVEAIFRQEHRPAEIEKFRMVQLDHETRSVQ